MIGTDVQAAHNALVEWFQSQSVKPADAIIVMSSVMAHIIAAYEIPRDEIDGVVYGVYQALSAGVAELLND